jgi:hypothetical protein
VGPVGSAGEPQNQAAYHVFDAESVRVYVAQELWELACVSGGRLGVWMPGSGAAGFRFEGLDPKTADHRTWARSATIE